MTATLHDVVSVQCLAGYRLRLSFDDGRERLFDMAPWLDCPPFHPLAPPFHKKPGSPQESEKLPAAS